MHACLTTQTFQSWETEQNISSKSRNINMGIWMSLVKHIFHHKLDMARRKLLKIDFFKFVKCLKSSKKTIFSLIFGEFYLLYRKLLLLHSPLIIVSKWMYYFNLLNKNTIFLFIKTKQSCYYLIFSWKYLLSYLCWLTHPGLNVSAPTFKSRDQYIREK